MNKTDLEVRVLDAYKRMRELYPDDDLFIINPRTYEGHNMITGKKIKLYYSEDDEEKVKPMALLSDDEKVILKNIITDNYKYIHRDNCGVLWISQNSWLESKPFRISDLIYWFGMYRHLFQFIQKGEEYSIKRLLEIKEEAEMPL